jgi:hypothetical protein
MRQHGVPKAVIPAQAGIQRSSPTRSDSRLTCFIAHQNRLHYTLMSDQMTPVAGGDEFPYSRDTISGLLKCASWYVRLRRPQKVERLVAMAIDIVENNGGMLDAGVNRLLDDYADTFRRLKRPVIAGQLADLAQRVRNSFPGEFTPAGEDVPWWLQEKFISRAPALPFEFHSSHAEEPDELNVFYATAVAFAFTLPIVMILTISIEGISGTMFLRWHHDQPVASTRGAPPRSRIVGEGDPRRRSVPRAAKDLRLPLGGYSSCLDKLAERTLGRCDLSLGRCRRPARRVRDERAVFHRAAGPLGERPVQVALGPENF